ncbi:MAG: glycosyltransferase family 4 protein [Anaerolineales bacterium]
MFSFGLFSIVFSTVAVGVWGIRRYAAPLGFVDKPGPRSSHAQPTPTSTGVIFVTAVPLAVWWASAYSGVPLGREFVVLAVAGGGLAALGMLDDRRSLPVWMRLLGQVLAAVAVVGFGGYMQQIAVGDLIRLEFGAVGRVVTVLWIVGLANIYNFMDGVDGLAAGQALITAIGAIWVVGLSTGGWPVHLLVAITAGMGGFLVHNISPARAFMGDAGSVWLGFVLASMAALPAVTGAARISAIYWAIAPGLFLFDAGFTLLRRLARRESLWRAHRSHLYQRLYAQGWSHGRITGLYLSLGSLLTALAVLHVSRTQLGPAAVAFLVLLTCAGVYALVRTVEAHAVRAGRRSPV